MIYPDSYGVRTYGFTCDFGFFNGKMPPISRQLKKSTNSFPKEKKSREVLSEMQENQLNEIRTSHLFEKMFGIKFTKNL
ncbi:hypothetical protein RIR_jg13953.t1 [Rhizophagus irregularis DAOM 181602=DAOM 197198]|nr:hypothetical protein RIR_jg13953.t1 [Rhizophagus irregularis DAOM 181602=DAOM 197198]